jgi:tRNA-Thr(GGU) m(6)t(6)A37 methyltransferase TsaA
VRPGERRANGSRAVSRQQTRGVFATRAPSRPNPIGLSSVRLLAIDGTVLRVVDVDILDGTPLLDIKPYLPECDAFPVERIGWCGNIGEGRLADNRFMRADPDARP